MESLLHLFSDPILAGVAILVAGGALFAALSAARPMALRVRVLRGVWIVAFVALAMWGMQQDRNVRAGGTVASPEAPAGVEVGGTTRYVSEAQAFRHAAVLWVILGATLTFALVELRVLRREPRD